VFNTIEAWRYSVDEQVQAAPTEDDDPF